MPRHGALDHPSDERYSDSLFSTNAGGYSVSKAFSNCKNLKEITLYENPKKITQLNIECNGIIEIQQTQRRNK